MIKVVKKSSKKKAPHGAADTPQATDKRIPKGTAKPNKVKMDRVVIQANDLLINNSLLLTEGAKVKTVASSPFLLALTNKLSSKE